MCGIAGIVGNEIRPQRTEQVMAMVASLGHRGPDAFGSCAFGSTALGHARLSIIDLEGGAQPMLHEEAGLALVFNGEIFNYLELRDELCASGHRFRTHSDTEVILHLYQEYGGRCVEKMNGQWAFALWDERRRELFLSRDRLGICPLYYAEAGGELLFASEIKALLTHPALEPRIDPIGLDQLFTFWTPLPGRTIFENVRQLPPAHSAIYRRGNLHLERYWQLDYQPEGDDSAKATDARAEELCALLADATRLRLRSDVPVGAYLSGGLDSTFTAALAAQATEGRLRTFSIGFEDAAFDESRYQREAVEHLGTAHTSLSCGPQEIAGAMAGMLRHGEQPVLRMAPAPLFLLSRKVRESGYKVVVTGEGADELFGGYDLFKEAKIRRFLGRDPASAMRPKLLKRLYPYMESLQNQSVEYLQRFFHCDRASLADPFFSHLPRWSLTARLKGFFSDELRSRLNGYDALEELRTMLPARYAEWDFFSRAQYLETTLLLPGYLLSAQGERMTMAHSVEGRYPFLDHRVAEFAARLPLTLKMRGLDEKHLLKRAARGLVPASILERKKQPYRAPEGAALVTALAECGGLAQLSQSALEAAGLFKPAPVRMLVAKFASARPASVRDEMALAGILSTAILVEQFVHQNRGNILVCNHSNNSYAALS